MDTSMDASFKGMCRTCLTIDTNYHSIYDYAGDEMKICDMLDTVLPQLLILKRDELPKLMCIECLDKLLTAYNFHQMCIESEGILLKILCDNHVMPTTEVVSDEVSTQKSNSPLTEDQSLSKECIKIEVGEEKMQDCDLSLVQGEHEQVNDLQIEQDDRAEGSSTFPCDDNDEMNEEKKKEEKGLKISPKRKLSAKCEANEALTLSIHNKTDIIEQKELDISYNDEHSHKNFENSYLSKVYSDQHSENQFKCIKIEPTISGQYLCTNCPRRFRRLEALTAHLQSHRKSDFCNTFDGGSIKSKSRRFTKRSQHAQYDGEDKDFKCQLCDETFAQETDFVEHTSKHKSMNPTNDVHNSHTVVKAQFSSSQCGKSSNSVSNLSQHKVIHADAELRYQCSECPSKFKSISGRNKHAATHRTLDSHKCDICGSCFKQSKSLSLHKRKHNNEQSKFKVRDRQRLQLIKQETYGGAEE